MRNSEKVPTLSFALFFVEHIHFALQQRTSFRGARLKFSFPTTFLCNIYWCRHKKQSLSCFDTSSRVQDTKCWNFVVRTRFDFPSGGFFSFFIFLLNSKAFEEKILVIICSTFFALICSFFYKAHKEIFKDITTTRKYFKRYQLRAWMHSDDNALIRKHMKNMLKLSHFSSALSLLLLGSRSSKEIWDALLKRSLLVITLLILQFRRDAKTTITIQARHIRLKLFQFPLAQPRNLFLTFPSQSPYFTPS